MSPEHKKRANKNHYTRHVTISRVKARLTSQRNEVLFLKTKEEHASPPSSCDQRQAYKDRSYRTEGSEAGQAREREEKAGDHRYGRRWKEQTLVN